MNLPDNPFTLFDLWMAEAEASEPHDANAMALATATAGGVPSVRMVLLKDATEGGFAFYTNLTSRKGEELAENQAVSLLFHWKSLRRQIRIEGHAERVRPDEADAYFSGRARGSQIGAWASLQSSELDDRATLEGRVAQFEAEFDGRDVPRPPYWSGWRVMPTSFEYWIDQRSRLHQRYVYRRDGSGWATHMLYP